jgi:hypothetical protein
MGTTDALSNERGLLFFLAILRVRSGAAQAT